MIHCLLGAYFLLFFCCLAWLLGRPVNKWEDAIFVFTSVNYIVFACYCFHTIGGLI